MKAALQNISFKLNNLDWLRLFFALQVMVYHCFHHLNGGILPTSLTFINYLPGVPAFFFASGFLIYASCKNTSNNLIYAKNRFLRLFPGLVFVTFGGLFLILFAHWDHNIINEIPTYLIWFFAQMTIGQAYNPSLFNDIGLGVINGALWTITVEILFYIAVPIIIFLERKFSRVVYFLFFLSFLIYSFGGSLLSEYSLLGKNLFRYFELTPIVWGWMFMAGIICFKKIDFVDKYIKHFYLAIIPLLILITLNIPDSVLFTPFDNRLGLIYFLSLCLIILYLAFVTPVIKLNLDLSYSIYIWHLVIINFLLTIDIKNIFIAFLLVTFISLISWYLVEKPYLKKKQKTIRS